MIKIDKIKNKCSQTILILMILFFCITYIDYRIYKIISNYSIYVTFFGIFLIFIFNIQKIFKKNIQGIVIILVEFALLLITVIANGTGFGSLAVILNLFIVFIVCDYIIISNKTKKTICLLILISEILFFISNNERYFNTNVYGYIAFAMLPFSLFLINESKKNKILKILLNIVLIYITASMIVKSQSRACIMGLIFFLILLCIPSRIFKSKKFINNLTAIILILSIAIVFLYVNMWNEGIKFNIPYSNKSLYSGREEIWSELLEQYSNNIVFGIGSKYKLKSFITMNIHNSMLDVLVLYGIITFVLYFILLYKTIINNNNKIEKISGMKIFVAAVYGMILVSFFETNLVWTDVNIFFILCILFCHCKEENVSYEFKLKDETSKNIEENGDKL